MKASVGIPLLWKINAKWYKIHHMKNDEILLNSEQKKAVQHTIGPLLIIAGAGTGKTTVVSERIKFLVSEKLAKPEEILALTFTEKAAREMERRVDIALPYGTFGLWISTFHSFCDRILREEALSIGLSSNFKLMTGAETYLFVKRNFWKFDLSYFRPNGNPYKFIEGMIAHFDRLKDEDVGAKDYINFSKKQAKEKTVDIDQEDIDKYEELAKAYKVYEDLKTQEGVMDFSDLIDNTLKLFRTRTSITNKYKKQFKYILLDEFQDTNFAQYQLVKLLAPPNVDPNLNVVGDDSQCLPGSAIITTKNGEKRIDEIKRGDVVLSACGRGHTTFSNVSNVGRRTGKVKLLTFKLKNGQKLTVTDNHKLFNYFPAILINKTRFFVYLMSHRNFGWRLGITNNLTARLRIEHHADGIIPIGSFDSEQEARYFESYYACKYGIPTVPFTPRPHQAISGKWLDKLFNEIDTQLAASKLAADLHLELDSYGFMLGGVYRGETDRVIIHLQMCYRNYRSKTHKDGFVANPAISHSVWVETSSEKTINNLENAGYKLTNAKRGKRLRFQTSDLAKAWEIAESLRKVTGGIIDKKFAVGTLNYQHKLARIMPASHVQIGSFLPVVDGKKVIYSEVLKREEIETEITTYDLEVDKTHNFIANGVAIHNSIYKFRGAAISNILSFMSDYQKAKQIILNKSYRCPQTVLDAAYRLIKQNDPNTLEAKLGISKNLVAHNNVKGEQIEFIQADRVEEEAEKVVSYIRQFRTANKKEYKDFAILVRANNHSDPFIRALERARIPYQFLGPGMLYQRPEIKDLIAYLKILYDFTDSISLFRVLSMDIWKIPIRDLIAVLNSAKRSNNSLFEQLEQISHFKYEEMEQVTETGGIPTARRSGDIRRQSSTGGKEVSGRIWNKDSNISDESKINLTKFVEMVHRHQKLINKETGGQILYYFLIDSGLLKEVVDYKNQKEERRALNITKFFDKLKSFEATQKDASVFAMVDYLELAMNMGESPLAAESDWSENNAVNILTVHSAKGLEFPIVFLVNLAEGRFPSRERKEQIPIPNDLIQEVLPSGNYHLQEERRLFYVGMTRAEEKLIFSVASYYGEGKRERKFSPFIAEAIGINKLGIKLPQSPTSQIPLFEWKTSPDEPFIDVQKMEKVKIDYLSYSAIEAFKMCPLHYKLRYILKIPAPPTAAQSFGTSIHDALRDFYRVRKPHTSPVEDLKLIWQLLDTNWSGVGYTSKKHDQLSRDKARLFLQQYLQTDLYNDATPLFLERPFNFRIDPSLKILGKIDRVDDCGDGKIEIIDYKTGVNIPKQKELEDNLQMTIYALAATNPGILGKRVEQVKMSLYYFDKAVKVTTTRTKEELYGAIEKLLQIRDEIENSNFACSHNMFCKNCEYKMLCNE